MKNYNELVVALETIEKLTGYKLSPQLDVLAPGIMYSGLPGMGIGWVGGIILYVDEVMEADEVVQNCKWVVKRVLEGVGFGVEIR